jgi:hypothetical protein
LAGETNLYDEALIDPAVAAGEHPAFRLELLRLSETKDAGADTQKPLSTALADLTSWINRWFSWMKSERREQEIKWSREEELYKLSDTLKDDYNRDGSVFRTDPDAQNDVMASTRQAVNLPIAHDNVEQLIPRYYEALFGSDANGYCEAKPRERNDQISADAISELLNWQQSTCSNTPVVGYRFLRDAALYGAGFLGQRFEGKYRRITERIPLRDLWTDPAAMDLQQSRFLVWRRRLTVGELKTLRDEKDFAFTDQQLRDVVGVIPDDLISQHDDGEPASSSSQTPEVDELKQVVLDVWMQPDRWIYLLNETLVVGIVENPLWKDEEAEQNGEPISDVHYPIVAFTPVPELDTETEAVGVYGMSHVYLSKASIDLQNSVMWLMNRNLARSALGLLFGDTNNLDPQQANRVLRAGVLYPMRDPKNSVVSVQLPDVSGPCMNAIGFMQKWDDRLYGVTDAVRGEASYSSQTATATERLFSEASKRANMALLIGQQTMRDFWEIAIRLNRKFVDPAMLPRILGEKAIWAEKGRGALYAVCGLDICPTGMPSTGTKAYLTQNGLNLCSVIAQFKTQGFNVDPTPLLRDTIKAMGLAQADQIAPEATVMGFDPQQENQELLQGNPIEMGPNDDDKSHLDTHLPLFYAPDARQALKDNPVIFQAYLAHCMNHATRLDQTDPGAGAEAMAEMQGMGATPAAGEGWGSGQGAPGNNLQQIAAQPKEAADLAAQMGAMNGQPTA